MSIRIGGVAAAVVLGVLCCDAASAAQTVAAEPGLGRQSAHMKALLAGPVPPGYFEQLVLVQKLRIAEDTSSADALQRYLDAEAMAALENTEWKASATMRDAISRNEPAMTAARTKALFSTVIMATPADDPALDRPPASYRLVPVAPGLWAAENDGRTIGLRAVFQARNMTRARIEQAFGDVVFADPAIPGRMSCQNLQHPMGPGESLPLACSFFKQPSDPPAMARISAVWTAQEGAAPPWKVVLSEVHFAEPDVQIASYTTTPFWFGYLKARTQAAQELAAVSCGERDACFEDKKRAFIGENLLGLVTLAVLVVGAIPGWLIGRFATNPGRVLLRCFLAMCAIVLLAIASTFALGADWTLAAMLVFMGGGALVVLATLGMMIGLAAGKSMRAREASSLRA